MVSANKFQRLTCVGAIAIVGGFPLMVAGEDTVAITGSGSGAVGLLIDGDGATGFVNDRTRTSSSSPIGVGQLTQSIQTNEIVGFTERRPPKYLATLWTIGDDSVTLDFQSEIAIAVTVWIVKGPFDDQKQHAIEACIQTSAIWNAERMGVKFSTFQVKDATSDPDASSNQAFPNGDSGDAVGWEPLRDEIGFDSNRLNIYWVDTVDGSDNSGWSNFGAQIAMGKNTGDELLSHEIGHAFSLEHIDTDTANFNNENIMFSGSIVRQYVTEGQLFRAHLNPSSIINDLYNARSGEVERACSHGADSASCPKLWKRLWADGTLVAN